MKQADNVQENSSSSNPIQTSNSPEYSKPNFERVMSKNVEKIQIMSRNLSKTKIHQPIDIQVKQSSSITHLDEYTVQATSKSKFKQHKINGKAVAIVVDFLIQLKLSRSC